MCHAFLTDARFYQFLFHIDQEIAGDVRLEGCTHCGGRLHFACYPRKPRGMRCARDGRYDTRLSFCCANDGCRRRCTPPSVRFLGRKVYLESRHGYSAKYFVRIANSIQCGLHGLEPFSEHCILCQRVYQRG